MTPFLGQPIIQQGIDRFASVSELGQLCANETSADWILRFCAGSVPERLTASMSRRGFTETPNDVRSFCRHVEIGLPGKSSSDAFPRSQAYTVDTPEDLKRLENLLNDSA